MANSERRNNGEAGPRGGAESREGSSGANEEDVHNDALRGEGRGLSESLGVKPKRVVFPIDGKGGVGKTTVLATLAEWYANLNHKADLLDMDPDNKGAQGAVSGSTQAPCF